MSADTETSMSSASSAAVAASLRPSDYRAKWRHSATWLYLVMLLASVAALYVSFMLSAETLQLARHPDQSLGCDVNAIVSCSSVAESWQAEFIKFAGLSFPNAFFGIAAESVFVTLAVIGLARIAVPRWFAIATWFGGLTALAYAYWLFTQSLYVINALCPWCLGLMFATTLQFMALTHATVTVQELPAANGRFAGLRKFADSYYRPNLDLMIDVIWIVVLVAMILIKDGAAIF